MPTRKIADSPLTKMCRHPEHNPPGMQVFEPGTYEHTCPGCGHKMIFTVAGMTMYGNPKGYMVELKEPKTLSSDEFDRFHWASVAGHQTYCICGWSGPYASLLPDNDWERSHPANKGLSLEDMEAGRGHVTRALKCPDCKRWLFADGTPIERHGTPYSEYLRHI